MKSTIPVSTSDGFSGNILTIKHNGTLNVNKHTFWYLCALFPGNVDESPRNEEAAEEKGWIAQFVGEHSTAWEVL